MRKALGGLAAASILIGGTGCAWYTPQGIWEVTETEVKLESKNFVVRKLGAQGSASRTYLFGFQPLELFARLSSIWTLLGFIPAPTDPTGPVVGIPLSDYDIQARAMRELHEHWDGKGSVVFHNLNREWNAYGIPFLFLVQQNTVTADIYEFDAEYVDYATRGERGQ